MLCSDNLRTGIILAASTRRATIKKIYEMWVTNHMREDPTFHMVMREDPTLHVVVPHCLVRRCTKTVFSIYCFINAIKNEQNIIIRVNGQIEKCTQKLNWELHDFCVLSLRIKLPRTSASWPN